MEVGPVVMRSKVPWAESHDGTGLSALGPAAGIDQIRVMGTLSAPVPPSATPSTGGRVVVGVGDPARDGPVLAWARDEVAVTGARLVVCRAGTVPTGWSTMDGLMLVHPDFARAVHDVRQRLGGDRVDLWLANGAPDAVLAAASVGADLVVLGPPTRHRSPATRVAGIADQPVVIVRAGHGGRTAPFAGHVVAAIGGGAADPAVIEFALRYAAAHRVPVAAVHVSSDVAGDFWFDEDTLETHFRTEPSQLGLLARVAEPARARYPQVPLRLCVLVGRPADRLRQIGDVARLTVLGRSRHLVRSRPGQLIDELVRTGHGSLAVVPATGTKGW